ncbi:RagB/SusD family nutrient uptake outer membrane protein, partial [Pedobacter sp. HMWF019]|uniref:RagB/SusD family nutrient uptake outer membrane protein n=1 Tax=Pedobacter sp. HMWF019 TaxID=2056856 RepID=UPI000D488042
MKTRKIILLLNLMIIISIAISCKKFVEVDGPNTSLNEANIYQKDATAAAVLTGIYTNLSNNFLTAGDLMSTSFVAGLSSDELVLYNTTNNTDLNSYYTNTLNSQSSIVFWSNIYTKLYIVNAAIKGISNSTTLNPTVKQQLLGEALFMRAFCFFYLVNLYGDVPLVLTTDYKVNASMTRTSKELVWEQIVKDLKDAQKMLSSNYLDATLLKITSEKVRPTRWSATALLARTYLYLKDWTNA